ncbi:MAG: glycosyltransferase [Gammaproteobacteria bacterium]|jgi:glycosyltransferase involved in cell wall biosynthesis
MHVVQALVALNVGGSELVATELSEFLVREGHRVTVIAADGPIGDRVRACGAAHLDWPIGRKRLATLRYIRRLAEWFETERPDIVHVHSRLPAWICWRALQRVDAAIRPAFLTTMHGHYSVSAYSSIMARGRRTIAVSEHIRRYTLKNYPKARPDDIVTIHGGADRADFPWGHQPPPGWREQAVAEFPELCGRRWLLLPGRVTRWKGHVDFLQLIAALRDDYPEVHGLIVGGCRAGSRYQAELETLAVRMGIAGQLTFTGDRLDIRDWMAAAEIVFNLSNDPPEAFGRTVLETLCLGRPLIAWNHGGAAEILAEMFPAGAVPPLDYAELERRARAFLDASPRVPQSAAFGLEESMRKHLAVYRELIGSPER